MQTVTRFPPSPTGYLHIGGARTALFNWLYARKTGGEMVLRIEDTDRVRSTRKAIDAILDSMKWMGLTWNQRVYYQTGRFDRYRDIIAQLLDQGKAYYCSCSKERLNEIRETQRAKGEKPRYDGCCRNQRLNPETCESTVVRFRNPQHGSVVFNDVVRDKVEIANNELDDLIIARSDGIPTYNLTAVVDDMDMGVTHVIRGEDHINNTPRQINILEALGAPLPVYAHVPLILGEDGQRLSKRHGAVSVLQYRDMGILPSALLNYLVRLGWSHGDQEIFDIDEMIELFDIDKINKSPATFDLNKLLWINQQYIMAMDPSLLAGEISKRLNQRGIGLSNGPQMIEVVGIMRQRAQTLEEMIDKILYLYTDFDQYDPQSVDKHVTGSTSGILTRMMTELETLEEWNSVEISRTIKTFVAEQGIRFPEVAQPLRIAVSGSATTPSIDLTLWLVGKHRSLQRIEKAISSFSKMT